MNRTVSCLVIINNSFDEMGKTILNNYKKPTPTLTLSNNTTILSQTHT